MRNQYPRTVWKNHSKDKQWKFGYSLNLRTSHSILERFLLAKEAGGKNSALPWVPRTSMAHGGRRDSPVGESSLPSCRRSCHTSLPNPMGLNAVTWVTPVPAWGREELHQGLLL